MCVSVLDLTITTDILGIMKQLLLVLSIILLLLSLPVMADRQQRDYREHKGKRQSMSREQAANIVRERDGGRILDIRPRGDGYRVKTLRNGRVRVYEIDGDENGGRNRRR